MDQTQPKSDRQQTRIRNEECIYPSGLCFDLQSAYEAEVIAFFLQILPREHL